jgi:serine/threonine protein kinase
MRRWDSIMTARDQVFISYSHTDRAWLDRFKAMLAPLVRCKALVTWTDKDIGEGQGWRQDIDAAIDRSRAALLLVSAEFLASKFISEVELPKILEAKAGGDLNLYWVPVSPSLAESTALGSLQASWNVQKPLSTLSEAECQSAIKEICANLRDDLAQYARVDAEAEKTVRDSIADTVKNELGGKIELGEVLGTGDLSIVYGARRGDREVAVKAVVHSRLQDWAVQSFSELVQKWMDLRHPVFMKIYDVLPKAAIPFVIMERLRGKTLAATLRDRISKEGSPKGEPPEKVLEYLRQLAGAAAEAHARNLFLRWRSSDIFVEDSGPRLCAIRSTNMMRAREQILGTRTFTYQDLEYLSPEEYRGDAPSVKIDQYSLGLIGLEMLTGRSPVEVTCLADLEKRAEFFRDPHKLAGICGEGETPLGRVLCRLLAAKPDDRYPSMRDVEKEIIAIELDRSDTLRLAKKIYGQYCSEKMKFYAGFYEYLFETCPDAKRFFKKVNMEKQRELVDAAVHKLLNFRDVSDEPTVLTDVARRHSARGMMPHHFDAFAAAFETMLRKAGATPDELAAWRTTVTPGFDYMKRWRARPIAEAQPPSAPLEQIGPRTFDAALEKNRRPARSGQASGGSRNRSLP